MPQFIKFKYIQINEHYIVDNSLINKIKYDFKLYRKNNTMYTSVS